MEEKVRQSRKHPSALRVRFFPDVEARNKLGRSPLHLRFVQPFLDGLAAELNEDPLPAILHGR